MQTPSRTVAEHNTHLHFHSEETFAEIAIKWLKKCENHRGAVFSAESQTLLITSADVKMYLLQ